VEIKAWGRGRGIGRFGTTSFRRLSPAADCAGTVVVEVDGGLQPAWFDVDPVGLGIVLERESAGGGVPDLLSGRGLRGRGTETPGRNLAQVSSLWEALSALLQVTCGRAKIVLIVNMGLFSLTGPR
jgi:hypothetical protein